MIDFIAISGSLENKIIEYVDHLHEHFFDPVVIKDGHYMSITMKPTSLNSYSFPDGKIWQADIEVV